MLKQVIFGIGLLALSSAANAAFIISKAKITGADMTGMSVTVNFSDNSSETALWMTTSDTLGTSGRLLDDEEGLAGGAFGSFWNLTVAGNTDFNFGDGNNGAGGAIYGDWVLQNEGTDSAITSFVINGEAVGIAFDIIPIIDVTPGSSVGRPFDSLLGEIEGSHSGQVNPEFDDLFWQLDVNLVNQLEEGDFYFFASDTDGLVKVSAPASIGLMFTSLVLFANRRRSAVSK